MQAQTMGNKKETKPTVLASRLEYIAEEVELLLDRLENSEGVEFALGTLKDKLSHIRTQFAIAQEIEGELLCIVPKEARHHYPHFTEKKWPTMREKFEILIALLDSKIDLGYKSLEERTMLASTPTSPGFRHSHHGESPGLRLPKIEITPFDGNYDNWQNFSDIFLATVGNNSSLSAAMKMQHLKTLLTGEAANIISTLTITDANYSRAWELLTARYDNKRALISHQLNKLAAIPNVSQDSVDKIRTMRDTLQVSLGSLDLLGCSTENWGTLLVHQMAQKFSIGLRKEWEKTLAKTTSYPTYEDLTTFLNDQINILENLEWHKGVEKTDGSTKKPKNAMNTSVKTNTEKCAHCSQDHKIYQCTEFQQLNPQQRDKVRKDKHLCLNCLTPRHKVQDCESTFKCRVCHKKHHTLLHFEDSKKKPKYKKAQYNSESSKQENQTKEDSNKDKVNEDPSTSNNLHTAPGSTEVMLATALVKVYAPNGISAMARALIDSGSESSFVSESLAQCLKLKRMKADITINGLQGAEASSPKHAVSFELSGAATESPRYAVYAYVLQTITAYRPKSFQPHRYAELKDLVLADPAPSNTGKIDLLLGADVIGQFWQTGVIHLKGSGITAQASALGWILSGPVETSRTKIVRTIHHTSSELPDLLKRFWEIEEAPNKAPSSEEDERCEKLFRETTTRDEAGRYCVQLPLTSPEATQKLGESRSIAIAAWKRQETQLNKDPKRREKYDDFMREYEQLKHMSEIPESDKEAANYVYVPHHAVFRDDSPTTQLRVVFNASSKTRGGTTLNDVLSVGPKLQNDVADVITNWRIWRYVYSSDITKMFRQIEVHPDCRWLQCIVWRPAEVEQLKFFKLNTVTYGTRPAPYLANRIIKAVAEDHGKEYPLAVEPLDKCTYVDDVLFGADSKEQAREVRRQVETALAKGCLELRKWSSNSPDLLPDAADNKCEFYIQPEGETDKKVLGLVWSAKRDEFTFKVSAVDVTEVTKRSILSNIARLFDPLGWISPFVVRAKMLMQSLWLIKADWDDENLPEDTIEEWRALCEEMVQLGNIAIPRFVGPGTTQATVRLIGFSDASKHAYAAAVYLYVEYPSGEKKSNLLRSKTRVAPVKTQSIPRLELCGAVELAKLFQRIRETWLGQLDEIACYTDSQIVLDWLAKHASKWHTFVANRVSSIQTMLPDVKWSHVPTKQNPADLNSRGLSVMDLAGSQLWWKGPDLAAIQKAENTQEEEAERKLEVEREACHVVSSHLETIPQFPEYMTKFSSWLKIIRVIAYCYKYLNKLRERIKQPRTNSRNHGLWAAYQFRVQLEVKQAPWHTHVLSRDLIVQAYTHIYKFLQELSFHAEIARLKEKLPVSKGSVIYQLSPFLDENGVLRVGGRLQHSNLSFAQKHPVILANSRVTNTLIRHFHLKAMHGGLQLTLALIRERHWIVHVRNRTKLIIRKCVKCARQRAEMESQLMSALPAERCTQSRPFLHVGIDYAGPFQMKNASGRGHTSHKVWIAIFVCFATRAVHLEVANDYSTQGFLSAFKSFVGRRGKPSDVYSDNQPAFQGADAELRREFNRLVRDPELHNALVTEQIQWHFIPPEAPHFGGIWEAAVRAFKHHFKRVLGKFIPAWDEMRAILAQIEACLNSRPITPQRDDVSEDLGLTPGHALIGTSLEAIPEPSVLDLRENSLSRWQTQTRIVQSFWQRWRQEYLQTLQRRTKWQEERENLKVNDIVLLKKEKRLPGDWALAKVIEVRPSKDGRVREVVVATEKSEYTRPITELCKLPVEENCLTSSKSPCLKTA